MFHPFRGYVSPCLLRLKRGWRRRACYAPWYRRVRSRDILHIVLILTAVYFFADWFPEPSSQAVGQSRITVWRDDIQQIVIMDIEEYIIGVVAAEMPATFALEALKAQAVAARTFAVNAIQNGSKVPGHPEAVVSTDHRVSQAWVSESDMRQRYGFLDYYWRWRKVSQAVEETSGLVLTYKGEPILAAYHANSGGQTENSENYWSSPLPYLRSVSDPYVDKTPTIERVPFSTMDLKVKDAPEAVVPASVARGTQGGASVEVVERYPSGRVKWVRVGERIITGRVLRESLGLRSNWFDVDITGSNVQISVYGYGHGVGMSQVGADGFAQQGATYEDILTHYYQGVQLTRWY